MPSLDKIDHVHIYVKNREISEKWYKEYLGFKRVDELEFWATAAGPLTLENGSIHLALFERENPNITSTIAFGVDASNFLRWVDYLSERKILDRVTDHEVSFSLYFNDIDGNMHEITTYEHEMVRRNLKES